MENSISSLNNKAWYRLIKVVYLFLLIAASFLVIAIIFSANYGVIDIANSKVICQYGNEKSFLIKEIFSKDEIPVILPNYDKSADSKFTETILKSCDLNEIITRNEQPKGFIPDPYRIEKWNSNDVSIPLMYSLLGLIITILFFEIIRRSFYYIVLGSVKPKK